MTIGGTQFVDTGTFEHQGYVILRGMLEPNIIENVRNEMERLVDREAEKLIAAGEITDTFEDKPLETRLFHLYENSLDDAPTQYREELHLAVLYEVFFHPRILDFVESVLGSEVRLYPNYTVRPKLPDWEGTLALWHQDGAYTEQIAESSGREGDAERLRMVNVWTPLVPARVANGCMQFIPETHKLGVVPHTMKRYYLEIEEEYLRPRLGRAVDVELDPGDVVLFSNLLFHQGQPNRTKEIRWSLDWRYQDATQPTLRKENGHIARSRRDPSAAVQTPQQWASMSFT